MKHIIIGDIHGRTIWKDIIDKEQPDITVFLGDYVSTHEGISSQQQIENLEEILSYKENNPDSIVLLRGNHDIQHLGYHWAQCSGYDYKVSQAVTAMCDRFLADTQWLYLVEPNIICSHAGVSTVWLRESLGIDTKDKGWVDKVNDCPPSELFGFIPDSMWDNYGDSETQPLTWIRPSSLIGCMPEGYTQIVGHTPTKDNAFNLAEVLTDTGSIKTLNKEKQEAASRLWLADSLHKGSYLTIEDGEIATKAIE